LGDFPHQLPSAKSIFLGRRIKVGKYSIAVGFSQRLINLYKMGFSPTQIKSVGLKPIFYNTFNRPLKWTAIDKNNPTLKWMEIDIFELKG
jgi:hypothetical protein